MTSCATTGWPLANGITWVRTDLQAIVQGLVSARQSGQPWVASFQPELSADDAYAIQAGVASKLGWFPGRPQAWKVGGTTQISAAPLPQVLNSPATWDLPGQSEVLVEAELAFRLGRTPDQPGDVLACLDSVCVSIEVIGTRLAGGLDAPPHWKLADQGVHAGLIMGAEAPYAACAEFTLEDWRQQACQVSVNGQVVKQARGSHPSVSPLTTLPWLVSHAAAHTGGLRAGDLITTGAWVVATAHPGDHVEVSFEGFGAVSLQLSAP
jgi:2-keto-4-pentenoate hydratase